MIILAVRPVECNQLVVQNIATKLKQENAISFSGISSDNTHNFTLSKPDITGSLMASLKNGIYIMKHGKFCVIIIIIQYCFSNSLFYKANIFEHNQLSIPLFICPVSCFFTNTQDSSCSPMEHFNSFYDYCQGIYSRNYYCKQS